MPMHQQSHDIRYIIEYFACTHALAAHHQDSHEPQGIRSRATENKTQVYLPGSLIRYWSIGAEHRNQWRLLIQKLEMIAALQRLKTSYEPQEASSMMAFCINGKAKSMSELFMTHPPLDKRIEALRSGEYLK